MSEAATLPDPPVSVARLTVERQGVSHTVVLSEVRTWQNRVLDGDVTAHIVQPSTALAPVVHRGEGTVVWLLGHDLGTHDTLGDTLITYSLLLELAPRPSGHLRALWYEDHQELPRTFAMGAGPALPGPMKGLVQLDLTLTDADYGDEVHITGSLRRP